MFTDYSLSDNTIAYAFDRPMDDITINALKQQIESKLAVHDGINIYLEDRGIHHFTLYSVLMGVFFPIINHKRFLKVALVTDRKWIHLLSTINHMIVDADIRNCVSQESEGALQWISEN